MILTEIFVVVCALTGGQCINYVHITRGNLSMVACERAIQEIARDHTAPGTVLHRGRSSCTLVTVNTQNDLTS
jgi:hypothetical protein